MMIKYLYSNRKRRDKDLLRIPLLSRVTKLRKTYTEPRCVLLCFIGSEGGNKREEKRNTLGKRQKRGTGLYGKKSE